MREARSETALREMRRRNARLRLERQTRPDHGLPDLQLLVDHPRADLQSHPAKDQERPAGVGGVAMGEVIHFNFGRTDALLTKKHFAQHPEVRRSTRWVEQRVNEGLPSRMDGNRRMFPLEDCLAWLKRRHEEKGAA